MEGSEFSETWSNFYQTAWCHSLEGMFLKIIYVLLWCDVCDVASFVTTHFHLQK
jgi:hypothetical protein